MTNIHEQPAEVYAIIASASSAPSQSREFIIEAVDDYCNRRLHVKHHGSNENARHVSTFRQGPRLQGPESIAICQRLSDDILFVVMYNPDNGSAVDETTPVAWVEVGRL